MKLHLFKKRNNKSRQLDELTRRHFLLEKTVNELKHSIYYLTDKVYPPKFELNDSVVVTAHEEISINAHGCSNFDNNKLTMQKASEINGVIINPLHNLSNTGVWLYDVSTDLGILKDVIEFSIKPQE